MQSYEDLKNELFSGISNTGKTSEKVKAKPVEAKPVKVEDDALVANSVAEPADVQPSMETTRAEIQGEDAPVQTDAVVVGEEVVELLPTKNKSLLKALLIGGFLITACCLYVLLTQHKTTAQAQAPQAESTSDVDRTNASEDADAKEPKPRLVFPEINYATQAIDQPPIFDPKRGFVVPKVKPSDK